jgi:hypothetical protein
MSVPCKFERSLLSHDEYETIHLNRMVTNRNWHSEDEWNRRPEARADRVFRASPFPLPPLAEQRRIVAKVDALMTLCDRLDASLTTTAGSRHRLLEALLAEALVPATDLEMEAAE